MVAWVLICLAWLLYYPLLLALNRQYVVFVFSINYLPVYAYQIAVSSNKSLHFSPIDVVWALAYICMSALASYHAETLYI